MIDRSFKRWRKGGKGRLARKIPKTNKSEVRARALLFYACLRALCMGSFMTEKALSDLKIGEQAVITELGCAGVLRRRIIDMGLTPGAAVKMLRHAPLGDPLEIRVRGYELSIRRSEASKIMVVTDK